MPTPSQKGAIAETAIAAEAVRLGIEVYRPIFEGGRYDMIFAFTHELMRVQCKWANRHGDVIAVRLVSSRTTSHGYVRTRYTEQEIDAVAAYCPELNKSYLLPISLVARRSGIQLRLAPARNNQRRYIHRAADYELGAIAQLGERRRGTPEAAGSSPASSTDEGRPPWRLFLV